jgi:hypothetical protein
MRLAFVEKMRHLLERHPVIAMKDHAFEQGFDDLGYTKEDLDREVEIEAAPPAAPSPDDEIDSHVEADRAAGNGGMVH